MADTLMGIAAGIRDALQRKDARKLQLYKMALQKRQAEQEMELTRERLKVEQSRLKALEQEMTLEEKLAPLRQSTAQFQAMTAWKQAQAGTPMEQRQALLGMGAGRPTPALGVKPETAARLQGMLPGIQLGEVPYEPAQAGRGLSRENLQFIASGTFPAGAPAGVQELQAQLAQIESMVAEGSISPEDATSAKLRILAGEGAAPPTAPTLTEQEAQTLKKLQEDLGFEAGTERFYKMRRPAVGDGVSLNEAEAELLGHLQETYGDEEGAKKFYEMRRGAAGGMTVQQRRMEISGAKREIDNKFLDLTVARNDRRFRGGKEAEEFADFIELRTADKIDEGMPEVAAEIWKFGRAVLQTARVRKKKILDWPAKDPIAWEEVGGLKEFPELAEYISGMETGTTAVPGETAERVPLGDQEIIDALTKALTLQSQYSQQREEYLQPLRELQKERERMKDSRIGGFRPRPLVQ